MSTKFITIGSTNKFTTMEIDSNEKFLVGDNTNLLPNIGVEYGGGKIGYIVELLPNYIQGLIVSVDNLSSNVWGCHNTTIGANSQNNTTIFAGIAATEAIVNGCSTTSAARDCNDLSLNGYTDWHLPSRGAHSEFYANKNTLGNFGSSSFWSSNEATSTSHTRAIRVSYNNGANENQVKSANGGVRPCRYFEME